MSCTCGRILIENLDIIPNVLILCIILSMWILTLAIVWVSCTSFVVKHSPRKKGGITTRTPLPESSNKLFICGNPLSANTTSPGSNNCRKLLDVVICEISFGKERNLPMWSAADQEFDSKSFFIMRIQMNSLRNVRWLFNWYIGTSIPENDRPNLNLNKKISNLFFFDIFDRLSSSVVKKSSKKINVFTSTPAGSNISWSCLIELKP
jgi:hypothetical protein